jgi:hypothetical protein
MRRSGVILHQSALHYFSRSGARTNAWLVILTIVGLWILESVDYD